MQNSEHSPDPDANGSAPDGGKQEIDEMPIADFIDAVAAMGYQVYTKDVMWFVKPIFEGHLELARGRPARLDSPEIPRFPAARDRGGRERATCRDPNIAGGFGIIIL